MPITIKQFYSDVNKNWLANHKIPTNDTSISYFDTIEKQIEEDLHKIVTKERKTGSEFGNFLESFYTGRMNDIEILHLFAESISNFTDHAGLMRSIGILNLYDLNSPIKMDFSQDSKNNASYTIVFEEANTGLSKREYTDGEIVAGYKEYLAKFGKELNFPVSELFEIEKQIVKFTIDDQDDVDIELLYNPMTYKNLREQFELINFDEIFDACKIPLGIRQSKIFIVSNLNYLRMINRLLAVKPLKFWKVWLKSCVYTSLHYILPGKIYKPYFEFYSKQMTGQKHESSVDHRVLELCKDVAADTLGKLYIESNLAKFQKIKTGATEIIRTVKDAAKERIKKLTWLSESSRRIAIYKLQKMRLKVAYPDNWVDNFKGLKMDKKGFLMNLMVLARNYTLIEIDKLTHYTDVQRDMWDSPCYEVNAFYYGELNMFCIPIGFLFPPFYGDNLSYVQIIAGLGNIVGHEISHGFDKDGRKFDEHGNNFPWWTSVDLELYHSKTKQVVDLFNNQDFYGLKINGAMTLDENLADFGAIAITLDVLKNSWAGLSLSEAEKKKQLREFFTWYSKTWVYKTTREHQKLAVKTNVHAPAELRVNALIPHFEDFYYAFDFDERHEGFIKPEDRVDVWG